MVNFSSLSLRRKESAKAAAQAEITLLWGRGGRQLEGSGEGPEGKKTSCLNSRSGRPGAGGSGGACLPTGSLRAERGCTRRFPGHLGTSHRPELET